MHTIDLLAGTHIGQAAKDLSAAAAKHGSARMTFNDITLTARAGDTADSVVADFDRQSDARHVAYINSPEGKAATAAREQKVADLQERHDTLMRDLITLDFTDDVAVLDWLCDMTEPCGHVGVVTRAKEIVSAFSAAGFEPNVNTGEAYKDGDRENNFRYLVGQALSFLKRGYIHDLVPHFIGKWKEAHIGN